MVRFSGEEGKLVCSFEERLDTDNCMKFENELLEKVLQSKGKPVVFNLAKVDYVSSLFLGICMRILKDAGKENFTLVNVHPNIKKVFKISGLDKYIAIG
jgi:anti-anti-sigma factor